MAWGIPASILLHAVFAFILFFHLPLDVPEPQKEETVSVAIVPPPEEEKKAEEQAKPEPPKPEEAKKKEPPSPEPEKKEEAKKQEPPSPPPPPPPPPPPEPPKEEAKKPEPPPPPPKQEEAKPEDKPGNEQGRPQTVPVLRPVFQFGEKDSGPRVSEKGNAAQEAAKPPEQTEPKVTETQQPPKPVEEKPEEVAETPPGNPLPNDVNAPEIDIASANPQQNAPSNGAAPDATLLEIVTSPPPPSAAKADPSKTPVPDNVPELKEAKTLFSRQATNDPVATTAMGNLPRGTRAGELCSTELREQLRNASYWPDFLPSPRLPSGTVLDVRSAGFRTRGQWYDLSFRCEIDEGATKVLSFAFRVGDLVPRGEWRKRGFPEF